MTGFLTAAEVLGSESTETESLAELYHENSKQRRSDRGFVERIIAAGTSPLLYRMMFTSRKRYRPAPRAALTSGAESGQLGKLIGSRRSRREFDARPLALEQVATILNLGMGETAAADTDAGRPRSFRAAPSAGALYPLEAYLLAERVDDLARGLHHYDPTDNVLEHIDSAQSLSTLAAATGMEELSSAPAMLVITAIPARSRLKYGERAYRFILIETGHVAQNMILAAEQLGLSACPIGGFVDDEVDGILGIDGLDEISLYIIAIGHAGC
jgi:SagB-type dehydrogenase family enzyme